MTDTPTPGPTDAMKRHNAVIEELRADSRVHEALHRKPRTFAASGVTDAMVEAFLDAYMDGDGYEWREQNGVANLRQCTRAGLIAAEQAAWSTDMEAAPRGPFLARTADGNHVVAYRDTCVPTHPWLTCGGWLEIGSLVAWHPLPTPLDASDV